MSDEELLAKLEDLVKRMDDPDKKIMSAGTKSYSSNEILQEVRAGTEFGREFLTYMKALEKQVGLQNVKSLG